MDTVKFVCFLVCAVSSYIAFFFKLVQVCRAWRDIAYVTMMTTLVLQCLTFTMGAVASSSDTFLGVRNLAILLMHLAAVAFCVSARILLLLWEYSFAAAKRRVYFWVSSGVFLDGLLMVLFFAGRGTDQPSEEFATGSGQPVILAYLIIFVISQALPLVTMLRQCVPYARMTGNLWLRRALWTLSASAVLMFLYCTARAVNILTSWVGIGIGNWVVVASVFSASGIFTLSVGLTMPTWGAQVSVLARWVSDYRSYRALRPLWEALCREFPDIVLEPPTPSVRDLHYRLYRRVIEIRDGWRALRPYMVSSETAARADAGVVAPGVVAPGTAQRGVDARQALAEATRIDRAIRARKAGATPSDSQGDAPFDARNAETLAAEIAWLKHVSMLYGRLRP